MVTPVHIENLPQREETTELAKRPCLDEVEKAVEALKLHKAGVTTGILLGKFASSGFRQALFDLLSDIWREGRVIKEWTDSVIFPIPKKGHLEYCDNWGGISLLGVVGKDVAKIL